MATAPFTLNITIPGDTDIVSQFPGVDRTHLDIINSWLKVEHNLNGSHNATTHLQVGVADSAGNVTPAPNPTANNTAIYRGLDGSLKARNGDDTLVEFLGGVPPGFIGYYAGIDLPYRWLYCDGSAVSRTTYARLFTAIGTTFGAGNGSTTFNVPDLNARTIISQDRVGAGRIVTYINVSALASTGGEETHTLTAAENGTHTHGNSLSDPGHVHGLAVGPDSGGVAPFVTNRSNSINGTVSGGSAGVLSAFTGVTLTNAASGSSSPHNNLQPSIILTALIRT